MSWDVEFIRAPAHLTDLEQMCEEDERPLGTPEQVRQALVEAGLPEPDASGSAMLTLDDGTQVEVAVLSDADAPGEVASVVLRLHPAGDPHQDENHPAWRLFDRLQRATGWRGVEGGGPFLGPDGRLPSTQPTTKPWWAFWR